MSRCILWFRCDQRLADNAALTAALASHDEVPPLFIIDPRQHEASPFDFDRSGPFRRGFIAAGLRELDTQLRAKGSALQVVQGVPAEVIGHVAKAWSAGVVHAQRLFAWEENEQQLAVQRRCELILHEPNTLLHPDDLPFSLAELPHVFTAFRTQVEEQWKVRDPLPEPLDIRSPAAWTSRSDMNEALPFARPAADPRAVIDLIGGRNAALDRLDHYCASKQRLGRYKETRNNLLGADHSSKFSPWLASGALGPREVYRAVKDHEAEHGASDSSYWMIFELLWRDFFQFTAAKHGKDLFRRGGIARGSVKGDHDHRRFAAWCEGRTGQPFIDANMRELAATGWMSNRGRQNVASYLVHDLGLDWRMGACWFEHLLIDYDPCSNWGNWQYVAGVGNDPREGRRFDPERQAKTYDPDGSFRRHWAPPP